MRQSSKGIPYDVNDAADVLMQSVLDWRKQVKRGQDVGSHATETERVDWVGHFVAWLSEREGVE